MIISAEVLARLVLEICTEFESSPYDLNNPRVIWQLIQERYPEVDGVSPPPTSEEIQRTYVMDFWASYSVPTVDLRRSPTIGPESEESIQYNEGLRAAGVTPEMMDPRRRLLSELTLLRSNPMAALSFVTSTAMGRNRTDAMRIARATGAVYELATTFVAAPVSDTTGEINHGSGPTVETTGRRVPDPYSASEIRSRLERGYHGGV